MSFKENACQQISLTDSFSGLTAREQKALEKSWAKVFADEIFPSIDEKRFSVLYSSKASRPNAPVNVIVGALIIKELFDYSDDEMVENLMLDLHLQYALHTTSFEEQPLSDKTLSRFRKRCYDYERLHGVDLYHDCVRQLNEKIAKLMGISGRIRRMDSMMVESNIRKLSRMELLYTCIAKLVSYIVKNKKETLPEQLNHYADPNDFNQVIYHQRGTEADERIKMMLADADALLNLCADGYDSVTEYELFVHCLSEQTIVEEGIRRLRTKADGGMGSTLMQNPSDPEATFRSKAGKEHRGYVANIEESVGENGSVITDYQYEQNIYSDSQFIKDRLADFIFNEEGTRVLQCPAGHEPKSCTFMKPSGQCMVSFQKEYCENCPHKNKCKPKIFKRVSKVLTSKAASERAKTKRFMKTDEFKNYARLRNGVETVPSNLRKNYHLEKLPRGKQRGKFFFGCKIIALNFRKLFNFTKGLGHYAQNPVIA